MYESIRGRLTAKEPGFAVVEAGGLGYRVLVPLSTFERLPPSGSETFLRTHLVVREDDWRLFGFATEEERTLFRACLGVSGVGPATALALLSGMPARDLRAAVATGDVAALTRIKGIGKKTAERLVVDLKDALLAEQVASGEPPTSSGVPADAVAALVALGIDPAEAADRIRRATKDDAGPTDLPALVRRALKIR
jgi:holliday junction DNA helicase RuvA